MHSIIIPCISSQVNGQLNISRFFLITTHNSRLKFQNITASKSPFSWERVRYENLLYTIIQVE